MSYISNQCAGTCDGTIMAIVGVMDFNDMLKTAILAAIGAIDSFIVSTSMKRIFKSKKKKNIV